MSDQPAKITKFALQDILLGIAEGLTEAQEALRSLPPYDAYGRPNTMYQLPYLDFNLQVTAEFEASGNQPLGPLRFQAGRMAAPAASSQATHVEVFSTISGRFVATVPNEGLPQTVLQVQHGPPTLSNGQYKTRMEAHLGNVAGENHVNARIEFNFDAPTSETLNGVLPLAFPSFSLSEALTDARGNAATSLSLPVQDYNQGYCFVFVVNAGTVSKSISISKSE